MLISRGKKIYLNRLVIVFRLLKISKQLLKIPNRATRPDPTQPESDQQKFNRFEGFIDLGWVIFFTGRLYWIDSKN